VLRAEVLARDPLCRCELCGAGERRVRPSTVADHIVPHRGDADLFWDPGNLQGLAKTCHDRKTRREGSER
jgi:5-methylcytosine-specific restriction protein A